MTNTISISNVINITLNGTTTTYNISKKMSQFINFYPSITSQGLILTFGAFSILDAKGNIVNIPRQSIIVFSSNTQYIALDLGTLTYVQLAQMVHYGAIGICQITSNATDITSIIPLWNAEPPKTSIYNFLTKLANAKAANDVRIAILGDSLMDGAGGTPHWQDLLFNVSYASSGYNIPNLSFVTVDNHAIGSSTSAMGMAMMAEGINSLGGQSGNTVMAYAAANTSSIQSPPNSQCGKSPLIKQPYDLMIIGYGANGGSYDLAWLENVVINIRKAGTDVIIVTENFHSTDDTFLLDHFPYWIEMAQAHGCAIADTWNYMLSSQNAGNNVFADNIHPSALGQIAYATAITGVINPQISLAPLPAKMPVDRVVKQELQSNDATTWGILPSYAQIAFTPWQSNGTTATTTTVEDVNKNPALLFGGKSINNAVTSLTSGQTADFCHPWAFGVDFLVDGSTTFTADLKTQNGTVTIGTVSNSTQLVGRCFCVEGVSGANYANLTQAGRANENIRVVCTSGTMKILGAVFYTDRMKELNLINSLDIGLTGTWATEAWINNVPFSYYTDTLNDYLNFDYFGSDCVIYLNSQNAAGVVHVYLDGQKIINALDLYSAGNYLYPIYIPSSPYANNPYKGRLPTKHSVQIQLAAVGGSAQAPAASNRRLGLIAIHAFDRN